MVYKVLFHSMIMIANDKYISFIYSENQNFFTRSNLDSWLFKFKNSGYYNMFPNYDDLDYAIYDIKHNTLVYGKQSKFPYDMFKHTVKDYLNDNGFFP